MICHKKISVNWLLLFKFREKRKNELFSKNYNAAFYFLFWVPDVPGGPDNKRKFGETLFQFIPRCFFISS
jgi:hypothetical protein